MSGGFPHSEISGSQSICRLPEAYRRLSRLSSPLTAKASTVCAYSLDHITPKNLKLCLVWNTTFAENLRLNSQIYLDHIVCSETAYVFVLLSHTQIFKEQFWRKDQKSILSNVRSEHSFLSFQRLSSNGGAKRDRTADLLRAKQALSQLS